MLKPFLEAGKIVGTHGLKGELRVECWCDSPAFLCAFPNVYFENGKQKLKVRSRPHKNIVLMKIDGVETVEDADLLRGKILYIDRKDVQFEEGVHFIQDLIGCTVKDEKTGEVYGTVTNVFHTGANDVYEIVNDAKQKYLIPVIEDVVKKKDVEQGIITIVPMKGLFNDAD